MATKLVSGDRAPDFSRVQDPDAPGLASGRAGVFFGLGLPLELSENGPYVSYPWLAHFPLPLL